MAPYFLATSCSEPDLEFATLRQLAAAIVAKRDAMPGAPDLKAIGCILARGELPGGSCVAIRLCDGEPGTQMGYAFLPGSDGRQNVRLLMAAICLIESQIPAAA